MSFPKTSISITESKKVKVSLAKKETELPELRDRKYLVDQSKPLPTPLQNEFIPKEVLLSLASAANAGPCPENLLPPKKIKAPKGTLPRTADNVWHHPIRRSKFNYLIDHPVALDKAGRDISFLYDIKYVKGETRENAVCPPRPDRLSQSHNGIIMPHKPRRLADTLVPEEFHIVSNTGVSGLECYDDKYTTLLTDSENRLLLFPSMKPNKRVEVVQLNEVMDAMLERAGVEIKEYAGPTKIHKLLYLLKKEQTIYNTVFHELIRQVTVDCADRGELLSKIRQRYVHMLDQIARQMIEFYKDLVTQRMMDQRILEELYNFKNVIEELTRELCLVQTHDKKLTKEVEKAHRDLAQALLDAEKNSKIVEEYHELYTMQRGRMETDIKHLMAERDIWSSATYDLALKVIEKNRVIMAKKLYLNEKGWTKYTKHFIILLSTKDTTDLALLQKMTQKWRNLINRFKLEMEQTEMSTKETLQLIKEGLVKWQQFFKNNEKDIISSDMENRFEGIITDFKVWQKTLNEDREKYIGDIRVSKYDSLKISKHIQENWVDIGFGIFNRHKSMEGDKPPEQEQMEEILTAIGRLYGEFEMRINGDNGVSKLVSNVATSLDYCCFKFENIPELTEMYYEDWKNIMLKFNEMRSQLETLLNIIGTVPQDSEADLEYGSALQTHIFSMIQQWLLKISNEIHNGNVELQRLGDELHIAMIQWMVNLLIVMVPDFVDPDTLPKTEEESAEAHCIRITELELEAITLARKLYQYTNYMNSCCKGLVTATSLSKTGLSQQKSATDFHELEALKRECFEWITTCSTLLSGLKGRMIKLLTPEEKEHLFADKETLKDIIDSELSKQYFEHGKELKVMDKDEKEKETEEKPSTSTKEQILRYVGDDENVHSIAHFGTDVFSSWRESAEQGTLAQKYIEAMLIIEHTQEKLLQAETRAREAEEKFEDVNEKLHHTLIKNKDLENEIATLIKTFNKETEETKEHEREIEEEVEEVKPGKSSLTPPTKEEQRKEGTITSIKSRTKTKSIQKMKPK